MDEHPGHGLQIRKRTPEERKAYLNERREELLAAGKLEEAAALDALESIASGETVDEWVDRRAAEVAEAFHEAYERLAQDHGYVTRERSRVPWEDVPEDNKGLMIATSADLLRRGEIR